MSLHLITGGARSGKSSVAERLAASTARPVTVVVFGRSDDGEMSDRIDRHKGERPAQWSTAEAALDPAWWESVPDDACVILDCLGSCLTRVMERISQPQVAEFSDSPVAPEGFEDELTAEFEPVLLWLESRGAPTIVVTNEVGDGIVPMWWTARIFRDVLGRANRRLAGTADSATLVVCGKCIDLAALPSIPAVSLENVDR